jgi:hypothetical protein
MSLKSKRQKTLVNFDPLDLSQMLQYDNIILKFKLLKDQTLANVRNCNIFFQFGHYCILPYIHTFIH